MDPQENTTVTIHPAGDVTLVCSEADGGPTTPQFVDGTGAPLPKSKPATLECVRKAQYTALEAMSKMADSAMSGLVKHQKRHEPKCDTLIQGTKALRKGLSRYGLFPWVKRSPCDLEAILVRLENLEIDPVRSAGTDGSNCRLSTGMCQCEQAPNPNMMVSRIREKAAALRVKIENVDIDF